MAIPISNVTRRVVYAASGTGPYAFTFEESIDIFFDVKLFLHFILIFFFFFFFGFFLAFLFFFFVFVGSLSDYFLICF